MLAYPSPRLAALGALLCALAAAGYFWPPAFDCAIIGTAVVVIAAAMDLSLTARALRGRLQLIRVFPSTVTVARPRRGQHALSNRSALAVKCRVYEDVFPQFDKQYSQRWQRAGARSEAAWPLTITARQRGEQELGGAGLRVTAGFGLWVLQYRCEWRESVRVYPLIEELADVDLFAHRRRLWGVGQHQSRKFGRGTEFDSLREYTPDDEYRAINWKASARRDAPVVNQWQVEQARDLMLLIDCGRLMHTEIGGRPRLDRYLDAAVQLAYLAIAQKDRVGLLAFDAEVRRYVAPARRPRQLDELIEAMFDLKPRFVESDYALAITTLKSRQPKRGLVVLFTDLVDSVSSRLAVANLARLARTHLPVVVVLDDPAIPVLAGAPALELSDAYVKGAAEQFIAEKRRTLQSLRTHGCIIVNTAAERLNATLVNQYLQVKARNLL